MRELRKRTERAHQTSILCTDYRTEVIFEPLPVVSPDYRDLDGQVRSATGKLTRRLANFAAMTLEEPIEPEHVEPFLWRKAALREDIETLQHQLDTKQLLDTIKMIAYRAETALANSLREHLKRPDEARRLLSSLDTSEADLLPDPDAGTLTVRLHHSANAATDQAIAKLCEELNATEPFFRARICA